MASGKSARPGPSGGRPTFEFRLLESVGVTETHKTSDVSSEPPGNVALDADNGALAGDVVGSGGFGYADTGGKGSNGGEAATPSAGDAPDSTSPTGDDDAGRQDWEAGFDDWIDEKGELAALRAGDASTADASGAGKPGKDGGHE